MRLRREFAADGTLWFENPFPRVSGQFAKVLLAIACVSLGGPVLVAGLLASGAQVALTDADLVLLVAPAVLFFEAWRYRRRSAWGMPDERTPRRVGFRTTELVLEDLHGGQTRLPWNEIQAVGVSMRPGLSVTMHVLRGNEERELTNMNLDLLIKVRWALELSRRGTLSLPHLAEEWPLDYTQTAPPSEDAIEVASNPPIYLLPDRALLWRDGKGVELRRAEMSALRIPLLGADRWVVTAWDRQASVIAHDRDAEPLLEWLGNPPLPAAAGSPNAGLETKK